AGPPGHARRLRHRDRDHPDPAPRWRGAEARRDPGAGDGVVRCAVRAGPRVGGPEADGRRPGERRPVADRELTWARSTGGSPSSPAPGAAWVGPKPWSWPGRARAWW